MKLGKITCNVIVVVGILLIVGTALLFAFLTEDDHAIQESRFGAAGCPPAGTGSNTASVNTGSFVSMSAPAFCTVFATTAFLARASP